MRRKPRDPSRLKRPGQRLRWAMLWWLLIAIGGLGTVSSVSMRAARTVSLPTTQSFSGELRPRHAPVQAIMPAGLVLSEIVVEDGDFVQIGQTIAALDIHTMASRLEEVNAESTGAETLKACLMADAKPAKIDVKSMVPLLQDAIQLALKECHQISDDFARNQATAQAELDVLERRRKMLHHRAKLKGLTDERPNFEVLQGLVASALAGNELEKQIAEKAIELAKLVSAHERLVVETARQAQYDLVRLRAERRTLIAAIKTPRIVAPTAGTMHRIRRLNLGFASQEDIALGQVKPGQSGGYLVQFAFPLEQADVVQPGTFVELELMGWAGQSPVLDGRVIRISSSPSGPVPGHLFAEINLSEGSIKLLDASEDRLALLDGTTASRVSVTVRRENIRDRLGEVLTTNLGQGVLHRFIQQYDSSRS